MKRLLLRLGLLAFTGAAIFAGVLWWNAPTHRITQASADELRLGMTLEEVEAVIGAPPGDYSVNGMNQHELRAWWLSGALEVLRHDSLESRVWFASDGSILVVFDGEGRLMHKAFRPIEPLTFRDKVRWWTGM